MTLAAIVRETGPDPRHAVIWLHGLGADGHDFEPIVPELIRPHWPPLRFVFPHAPVRPVTINGGLAMRAWYDIPSFDFGARQDETGLRDSVRQVEALLGQQIAVGIPPTRLILAGFSQGGAVSLLLGTRRSEPLGGLIALSTYLPLHDRFASEASQASRATPIFMAHGRFDPVVPLALGELSARELRQAGYDLTWRTYPMPHSVATEEIRDLADWLETRFERPST